MVFPWFSHGVPMVFLLKMLIFHFAFSMLTRPAMISSTSPDHPDPSLRPGTSASRHGRAGGFGHQRSGGTKSGQGVPHLPLSGRAEKRQVHDLWSSIPK